MIKYCIGMIDLRPDSLNVVFPNVYYFGKRDDGELGWLYSIESAGIIWYDNADEAQSNLLDLNECVIARNILTEAEKAKWLSDPDYRIPFTDYPIPGMAFFGPDPCRVRNGDPKKVEQKMPEPPKQEQARQTTASDIPIPLSGPGSRYDLELQAFISSGAENAQVPVGKFGVTATTVKRQLERYAKVMGYPVEVIHRGDRVFLKRMNGEVAGKPTQKVYTRQVTTKVVETVA